MPRMSESDYRAYLARQRAQDPEVDGHDVAEGVERESELHAQIFAECNRRQWIALHGSMAHATHRTEGEPDFVILCDGGRVLLIECKSKTGKISAPQFAFGHQSNRLGHFVFVVRSFDQFLKIANQ